MLIGRAERHVGKGFAIRRIHEIACHGAGTSLARREIRLGVCLGRQVLEQPVGLFGRAEHVGAQARLCDYFRCRDCLSRGQVVHRSGFALERRDDLAPGQLSAGPGTERIGEAVEPLRLAIEEESASAVAPARRDPLDPGFDCQARLFEQAAEALGIGIRGILGPGQPQLFDRELGIFEENVLRQPEAAKMIVMLVRDHHEVEPLVANLGDARGDLAYPVLAVLFALDDPAIDQDVEIGWLFPVEVGAILEQPDQEAVAEQPGVHPNGNPRGGHAIPR